MIDKNKTTVSGKRKTAIAKATIEKGNGIILINKIPVDNLDFFKKLTINEPIEISRKILGDFKFDISVNVKGGGLNGMRGMPAAYQATKGAVATLDRKSVV